jgi:putative tricarboxylic transport membrane protein
VLGYVLVKLECEAAPLILGHVLGPLMEEYLRRPLFSVFCTRVISCSPREALYVLDGLLENDSVLRL